MLILIFHRGRNERDTNQLWKSIVEAIANTGFTLETRRLNPQTQALIITVNEDVLKLWVLHARITDYIERGIIVDSMLQRLPSKATEDWNKQLLELFQPTVVTMQERLRIMNRVLLHTLEDHRLLSQMAIDYPSLTLRLSATPHIHSIFPLHSQQVENELFDKAFRTINLSSDLIQQIRDEFGEKVAYLFTFQQFTIKWLLYATPAALLLYVMTPPSSLWYAAFAISWGCGMTADWAVKTEQVTIRWSTRHASDEMLLDDPRRLPIESIPSSPTVLDKYTEETSSLQLSATEVYRPWTQWSVALFLTFPIFLGSVTLLLLIQTFNLLLDEYITQKSPDSWWTWLPPILGVLLIQPLATLLDKLQPYISSIEFRGIRNRQKRENDQLAKRFVLLLLSGLSSFLFTLFVRIPLTSSTVRNAAKINYESFSWGDSETLATDMSNRAKTFVLVWQLTDLASSVGSTVFMRMINAAKDKIGQRWFSILRQTPTKEQSMDKDDVTRRIVSQVQLPNFEAYDEFLNLGAPTVFLLLFSILHPPIVALAFVTTLLDARVRLFKALKWSKRAVPERIENLGYLQGALRWSTVVATISNGTIAGLTGSNGSSIETVLWTNLMAQYLFIFFVWVSNRLQTSTSMVLEQTRARFDRYMRGGGLVNILPQLEQKEALSSGSGVRRRKLQVEIPAPTPTDEEWQRKLPGVWDAME
jgi:anoctamin-10